MGRISHRLTIRRRDFLRQGGIGLAVGAAGSLLAGCSSQSTEKGSAPSPTQPFDGKTILTFYIDDTNPYTAGADAFKEFLDFAAAHQLGGESSVILGYNWEDHGLLSNPSTDEQRSYIEQAKRAYDCGIDTHMELMTHSGLFDFDTGQVSDGAQHEGVWLHEPEVSQDQYEAYFRGILDEGDKIDIRFTGVTWPGCGCDACELRYSELMQGGGVKVNPNLWKALLNLASEGRFRGETVPCFVLGGLEEHALAAMASEGKYGVYDLYPHVDDFFGIWDNLPERVNADTYISADGTSGRIVEKINAGASHCVLYGHWQGLNPATGVGWDAFKTVVQRLESHYPDRILWMRPSALTDLVHQGDLIPSQPVPASDA
ncbi:MAG: hypothetical protein JSU96_13020 [Acidobacteriota bacterium]|nr:MAG: hypothetical protein JSU96_13020 [Acidobacteriota bacterium]